MATSLKEALLKSGLITKEKLAKEEAKQKRGAPPVFRKGFSPETKKKSVGFVEGKHLHHLRTQCDACGKTLPDVEYYEHRNKSLDKNWLCVKCADTHNISDEYRQTMQSQHALQGRFRREYGATKVFK